MLEVAVLVKFVLEGVLKVGLLSLELLYLSNQPNLVQLQFGYLLPELEAVAATWPFRVAVSVLYLLDCQLLLKQPLLQLLLLFLELALLFLQEGEFGFHRLVQVNQLPNPCDDFLVLLPLLEGYYVAVCPALFGLLLPLVGVGLPPPFLLVVPDHLVEVLYSALIEVHHVGGVLELVGVVGVEILQLGIPLPLPLPQPALQLPRPPLKSIVLLLQLVLRVGLGPSRPPLVLVDGDVDGCALKLEVVANLLEDLLKLEGGGVGKKLFGVALPLVLEGKAELGHLLLAELELVLEHPLVFDVVGDPPLELGYFEVAPLLGPDELSLHPLGLLPGLRPLLLRLFALALHCCQLFLPLGLS